MNRFPQFKYYLFLSVFIGFCLTVLHALLGAGA